MEKEIVVSNTSSLIFIAKLNILHLAKNMFKEIKIPTEVIKEIFKKEVPENIIISELRAFLKEVDVKEIKDLPLEKGERSGISYCLENNIKTFLSDDKSARKIAESLGLKVKGVLGILLWNLQHKNIDKKNCEELIRKLIRHGYYITTELYSEIINQIEKL